MADKVKVRNLDDNFYTKLQNGGLTYKEMMDDYNLTRWGARTVGDHEAVKCEKAGNKEKIFSLKKVDGKNVTLAETIKDFKNLKVPTQADEPNEEEVRRSTTSAKQTITNNANKYLRQLEREVKNTETPETEYEEPEYKEDGVTAIIHETDPHFSAHVKDRQGNTTYDTITAKSSTHDAFFWYREQIIESIGYGNEEMLDEIVLLLGGDLVEGENIYEGQAHKVEDKLDEQIRIARRTYFEEIRRLRAVFATTPLKIVCVSGNHGDLPVTSSSNADDIIYSQLEDMVDISDLNDVKFVRANRSDGVCFNYRGWKGYLTHGEHYRPHIGTSSPQSDWYATKDQLGFDAAWRGHYHNQKQENVGGAPVFMTNSRKPGDDYTDKISVYGVTGNSIYFATDDEPVSEVKTETQVL